MSNRRVTLWYALTTKLGIYSHAAHKLFVQAHPTRQDEEIERLLNMVEAPQPEGVQDTMARVMQDINTRDACQAAAEDLDAEVERELEYRQRWEERDFRYYRDHND